MTWREFEGLVAESFRQQGYRVVERGGDGPDGGVDLELHMGSDKYLVQCKQWKVSKVGVATVRELYGVMTAERAVGGFVVASGAFTDDAKEFTEGRSIKLVDARRLRAMIGNASPGGKRVWRKNGSGRKAVLPQVRQPDGRTNSQVGQQCREEVLGVFAVSGLPGCARVGQLWLLGVAGGRRSTGAC